MEELNEWHFLMMVIIMFVGVAVLFPWTDKPKMPTRKEVEAEELDEHEFNASAASLVRRLDELRNSQRGK